MKPTEEQIRERLTQIDADERYHYEPANVEVNSPLALEQVAMKSEAQALSWVLGIKCPKSGPKR